MGFAALLACALAGLAPIIVRRLAGTKGFVVRPRRWVAERTLKWFARCRRRSRDDKGLPEVSETMVTLAAIHVTLHRLAQLSAQRPDHHDQGCGMMAARLVFQTRPLFAMSI